MKRARGFAIRELVAIAATVLVLLAVVIPAIGGVRGDAGIQQSMANLAMMSAAHVLYAADWDGRQVTWIRDDMGTADSVEDYNYGAGCSSGVLPDPACQPAMVAGWGATSGVGIAIWGIFPNYGGGALFGPIAFPGDPNGCWQCVGLGSFRIPNNRPFHDYLNGRYHDPVFYAPNDTTVMADVAGCIDLPWEFVGGACYGGVGPCTCNPGWSSYALSPAAMFHPDVMRSNAAGGWQNPWNLDWGFESPGLFQALYPDLKTHMIEQNWVQGPPAECNPYYSGCEPYWFNQGLASSPATLFYDGHIRQLPNSEVLSADFQVMGQSGGVDGLWHRGTPFGNDGYFISAGYDYPPLSHHVLTTDGILGRDTLGGVSPLSATAPPSLRYGFTKQFVAGRPVPPPGAGLAFTPLEGAP